MPALGQRQRSVEQLDDPRRDCDALGRRGGVGIGARGLGDDRHADRVGIRLGRADVAARGLDARGSPGRTGRLHRRRRARHRPARPCACRRAMAGPGRRPYWALPPTPTCGSRAPRASRSAARRLGEAGDGDADVGVRGERVAIRARRAPGRDRAATNRRRACDRKPARPGRGTRTALRRMRDIGCGRSPARSRRRPAPARTGSDARVRVQHGHILIPPGTSAGRAAGVAAARRSGRRARGRRRRKSA